MLLKITSQTVRYIRSRSIRYWFWLIAALCVVWFVLYVFVSFSIIQVNITYHDNITGKTVLASSSLNKKDESVLTVGDLVLVRRESVSLKVSVDTYQTNKSLPPLPIVGITPVTINLYRDHGVEKYSGDSLGCVSYDSDADRVLSYSCTKPANLVYYNRPLDDASIWKNELVTNFADTLQPVYSIKPFAGGLLGMQQQQYDARQDSRNLLFTIDSNGQKRSYDLPLDISSGDLPYLSLVVDNSSLENEKFMIINNKTGDLYLGAISGGTVTYKNSAVSNRYNAAFDTLICTLLDNTSYCYVGLSSDSPENSKEEAYQKNTPTNTIETTDFSGDNPRRTVFAITKKIGIKDVNVTKSKIIYVTSQSGSGVDDIYRVQTNDNEATLRPLIPNVSSIAFGDGLIYLQNNNIYKFDDRNNESYLVFSSKKLDISNLIPLGTSLFFNAHIVDMPDQKLHTYKLLDHADALPTGKRIVDILPFNMGSSLLSVDYMANTIRVRVFATETPNKKTNSVSYNENEYNINKISIEDQLRSLGITTDKYDIVYSK